MKKIKKVFLTFGDLGYCSHRYSTIKGGETINFGLDDLIYHFQPEQDFYTATVDTSEDETKVTIYFDKLIKKDPEIPFRTKQEQKAFDKAHLDYVYKRYEEMPKVTMSVENHEVLKEKWEIVKELKPKYLIFTLDDSGSVDVVDMYWSDELSSDDQAEMKEESKKFRRWDKAYELYKQDHPFHFVSDYWYGPDDSFFESDLEPYYDRDTPLLEKKKYTKKQIGRGLKQKIARKEYPQFLGKWFYQVLCSDVSDMDKHFSILLSNLCFMEDDPENAPSYERLNEIADLIIAGRDDEIEFYF